MIAQYYRKPWAAYKFSWIAFLHPLRKSKDTARCLRDKVWHCKIKAAVVLAFMLSGIWYRVLHPETQEYRGVGIARSLSANQFPLHRCFALCHRHIEANCRKRTTAIYA